MFGSHLSIAGSMCNALAEAERLGMETVQVFTKNQQQWKAPPLKEETVAAWKKEVARLGWGSGCGPAGCTGRAVSHASYLINLASPDETLWKKSIDLMHDEIARCEALGIPYLVHHPGAHTGSGAEAGLARVAAAYAELFTRTRGWATVLCLENTVGAGSLLGRTFEELAGLRRRIIEGSSTADPDAAERVAFCFDTCHAHAGGHDMSTRAKAQGVLDAFDTACGLANMAVLHLNDSKGAAGSRLDRHEHIGKGTIGLDGFRAVVNQPALADRPKIMETPKGKAENGTEYDAINMAALRVLVDGNRTSPNKTQPSPGAASPLVSPRRAKR